MKQDKVKSPVLKTPSTPDNNLLPEVPPDRSFSLRIGGTEYLVSTHMKTEGKRTVLDQFKQMLIMNGTV